MKSTIKALAEVVNGEDLLPGSQTVIVTALERSELSSHEKTRLLNTLPSERKPV